MYSAILMIIGDIARRMVLPAMAGPLLLATALYGPLPCGAQTGAEATLLTIMPLEAAPITMTLSALTAAPSTKIFVSDDAGVTAEYAGVQLSDLLVAADVQLGKSIRNKRLAEYVLVSAADDYRVVFSLAELDPMFRQRPILLCYSKNGGPLPGNEGPLRLVVADEQRHARWVRQVTSIQILRVGKPMPSNR